MLLHGFIINIFLLCNVASYAAASSSTSEDKYLEESYFKPSFKSVIKKTTNNLIQFSNQFLHQNATESEGRQGFTITFMDPITIIIIFIQDIITLFTGILFDTTTTTTTTSTSTQASTSKTTKDIIFAVNRCYPVTDMHIYV